MRRTIKKTGDSPGKRKRQNVNFTNVEAFLQFLPEEELKIVELLRKIIFHCLPDWAEKLSYHMPFYTIHSNICFIWPSSVIWGAMKQKGVRMEFANGYLMRDEINYLDKGDRKHVYWKDFYSVNDIDAELVKAYIFEAAFIGQEMKRKKSDLIFKISQQ